jgi:hypothetical protein
MTGLPLVNFLKLIGFAQLRHNFSAQSGSGIETRKGVAKIKNFGSVADRRFVNGLRFAKYMIGNHPPRDSMAICV